MENIKELEELQRIETIKSFEYEAFEKGYKFVTGIDEVGRGPLAGPVVACALIMPINSKILGISDSKKISEKKRVLLSETIKKEAVAYSFGVIDNDKIDKINILQATYLAMKIAYENLEKEFGITSDFLLVDGGEIPDIETPQLGIIKGDLKSYVIGASSILAKVYRDNMMCEYDKIYPEYCFAKHKGYGTKIHVEAIKEHGICSIHRKTFLTKILNNN